MANDLLMPAQVIGAAPQQQAQMPSSALAAAMMGHGGMPAMQTPQIPLASLMQMMQQDKDRSPWDTSPLQDIMRRFGNVANGYQWNGFPGQGVSNALENQAQNYVAGGAAGL